MSVIKNMVLVLISLCCLLTAEGQDFFHKYIHIPHEELSIEQYLQYIENETGKKLTYSSAILSEKKILLNADSLSVIEVLDTLFTNGEVRYIKRDNLLILSPQTEKTYSKQQFKVSGYVKNSRNKNPISFAAVYVPDESIGTMANLEGAFELYLPADRQIDTLVVSCIGYIQKRIAASEFLSGPVDVSLSSDRYMIEEVIIRPEKPTELLLAALKNKGENYGTKPALLTAFFREATKQDNNYISLSEAVIDIYKNSYTSASEDLIKLEKGRKGNNIEESELVNLVVEGGLYNNIQLDIMKYGVSFLEPENFYNYEYTLEKQMTYNDRQTYIVDFTFRDNIPDAGFNGKIFLDVKTLAVARAEFEISESGLDYAKSLIVKKSPPGFKVKPKYGHYEVDYRFYNEKWHLMHARSEIGVKVKKERGHKNKGFSCVFVTTSEFVVTGTTTEGFEKIKYREASKPNDILFEQIIGSDLEFWGNENIILPDEPLQETIEKLLQDKNDKDNLLSTKPVKEINK
jgi:hypothetical protein